MTTKLPRKLIFILFFLLPFHVLIIYMLQNKASFGINDIFFIFIKMWKEAWVVITLLILLAINFKFNSALKSKLTSIDTTILLFIIIGLFYTILSDNLLLALWSFRSLFAVFFLYMLGRLVLFNPEDYYKFFKIMFLIAIITSIFGIIQVDFLGPEFQTLAYGADVIRTDLTAINYDKLRATSTFLTANEFGLFLVFIIFTLPVILGKNETSRKTKLLYILLALIILAGLAYSFSRSAILILLVGAAFVVFKNPKYTFIVLILLFFVYLTMDYLGVFTNLERVIQGTDPSTQGHRYVINEAFNSLLNNPLGIGLGKAGVVIRRFNPNAPQFEGEWFNLLVQMGLPGASLYLIIHFIILKKSLKIYLTKFLDSKYRSLALVTFLITLGMMLRDMILPRDQMNYWLGWFLIGAFLTTLQRTSISNNLSSELT